MYRALYRKWRPQRFEDVVGQRAIVTALKNQITANRVGHAYLFTGVRGTGKTTCAKIFAKAVNCLHPVNGDPCGECEICKGIDNGSILDVVEMDAASNNGVDDIRDLRDETAYTPSACKYKVYIIDEVHMLSTAAFNALLKTLEEPPAHVIFILATTEIQKVPATILSRCQRYDFTRIGPEDIAQRVEYIAGQEGLELTTGGAELISRLADGAMRDALSILDTCAGVTAKIDADVVRRMAGVTDRSYLFRISDAIAALASSRVGNYLAFFPSYAYLRQVYEDFTARYPNIGTLAQESGLDDAARAAFLEQFSPSPAKTLLGFGVMGGIFGEGVDLVGDRLIGCAIVGVGLPQVNPRQEILRRYYDESCGTGFDYAYRFPGMNKVLQAAGRVIRTQEDRGVVLLLDDRFARAEYTRLFPRHWHQLQYLRSTTELEQQLAAFWARNQ